MTTPKHIILGKINGLHGVRGWVKVFSYTDPPENILGYTSWQLYHRGQWQTVNVQEGQLQGKKIIASLENYTDRDQAAKLLGADVAVFREQLPFADEYEYYWSDLIGLTVVNQQQLCLGTVQHLLETGANDVLVVSGEKEYLIPFVQPHFITHVDLQNGIIYVDWETDF